MIEVVQRPLSPLLRAYRLVNRPYYLYRPAQLTIRLRSGQLDGTEPQRLRTAWGSHVYCWADPLGRAVARTGVYDLGVAETLARLADPGETAVDAGANVGFMSNLLAHAVGAGGEVVGFEPHPLILQALRRNVELLAAEPAAAPVRLREAAVSDAAGEVELAVNPGDFARNKGTATLAERREGDETVSVRAVRLEEELADGAGVVKLDVEGHELAALRGAESLLARQLIRDVVFEEHGRPPTPVTELLESHGYTVLGVRQGVRGPIVSAPAEAYELALWDPPALLATLEPERARRRLRARGWRCLRAGLGR